MTPTKPSPDTQRVWALRERAITPPNRSRARAMRLAQTEAERKLWWHLRHRLTAPGSHFRRQVQLGSYIVDFVCHGLRIAIEVDGGQHADQVERDARRTRFLEAHGYRVLRFWNNEVLANIDAVLEVIHGAILATPTPTPPHKGEGKEERP
jgi:very-short-patch-repair endonuclease